MAEISEQKLKVMELHDELCLTTDVYVMRVLGGWIYWRLLSNGTVAGVFVPEK